MDGSGNISSGDSNSSSSSSYSSNGNDNNSNNINNNINSHNSNNRISINNHIGVNQHRNEHSHHNPSRSRSNTSDSASMSSNNRWTCEACGCHTNQSSDRSCTICGTSHSGHSILRRPRGGASFAARAGWFSSRGPASSRRGMINDDVGLEDDDLWETVVNGSVAGGERDGESAIEALAMEVSGVESGFMPSRNRLTDGRHRVLDWARVFSQSGRDSLHSGVDPSHLLRTATQNAAHYCPIWVKSSSLIASRIRSSASNHARIGIEIGFAEQMNVAHLPVGATEGLAVRAEPPIPRSDILDPVRLPNSNGAGNMNNSIGNRPLPFHRKSFGFRVAFDHPTCDKGHNMGGCYLIGVTTSAFINYGELNGLQQSPYFWGIEDRGCKYEGPRYHQSSRGASGSGRRQSPTSTTTYSRKIATDESPMNMFGVLFGSRDVVTVIADLESHTLTFWRDEILLGTLVHSLPKNGNLYPVAVPFNCGVTVAITGLDDDPLPILRNFSTDLQHLQTERCFIDRQNVERSLLIHDGKPSRRLRDVLKEIFVLYSRDSECSVADEDPTLSYPLAARLWYRCGMKLSHLDSVLCGNNLLRFHDFLQVVERVIIEDKICIASEDIGSSSPVEVGDKVELVEAYEKFMDAIGGPLQPGDRGIVVELQLDPVGEKRSIRVLHGGRRWWYPPQSIISDRASQFESSAVWFIRCILRSHGYDHKTLECLVGRRVMPLSWNYGDLVTPYPGLPNGLFGRIVPEIRSSKLSLPPHSRESGTVFVEYTERAFAEAVGIKSSLGSSVDTIEAKRIHTSKLVHSNVFQATSYGPGSVKPEDDKARYNRSLTSDPENIQSKESLCQDIHGLAAFEKASIEALTKESKKNTDTLAMLFSAGLPDAILGAITVAERQMNSLEPRDDVAEKILSLGSLTHSIIEQLFTDRKVGKKSEFEIESSEFTFAESEISTDTDHQALAREAIGRELHFEQRNMSLTGNASAQHRRNLLLTLMSRASRRRNSDGRHEAFGIDFPASEFPSSLHDEFIDALTNETQSSSHGNSAAAMNNHDISSQDDIGVQVLDSVIAQYSFLDTILRCRSVGSLLHRNANLKQFGAAYALFARNLITSGVLMDNIDWTKSIIDEHCEKMQLASLQRPSVCLRGLVTEDGTPILQVAVALGCSNGVLHLLIEYGCLVGVEEIRKAAMTNQPESLVLLLQHTSFNESMIDLSLCSPEICCVLEETKVRQSELDKRMRQSAGIFVVQMLRKLLRLCLSARGDRSACLDQCCKAICEVLVGNVLLHALRRAQSNGTAPVDLETQLDIADRSGRFLVTGGDDDVNSCSQGLLGLLPRTLFGECLLSDKKHLTHYMMVIEDYLYSKDLADIGAGLTFVLVLLRNFPQLRTCSEMERFGIMEVVSYHSVFTSSRIAELLSKQVTMKLTVSPCRHDGKDSSDSHAVSESALETANGVVLCPKKHTAILHITRHSSFRCDLCGNGVECGRPMHGCRECDWDACEVCTDRAECGVIKSSAVKAIASECIKLLEDSIPCDHQMEDFEYCKLLQILAEENTTQKLNSLAVQLLQGDAQAAKELGMLMNEQGKVSVHQFLTIILPSLHASLVGQHSACSVAHGTASHQSKKPRVAERRGKSYIDSSRRRLDKSREMLQLLMPEREKVIPAAQLHSGIGLTVPIYKKRNVDLSHDDNADNENIYQISTQCRDMAYAFRSSELLRRLHQVLSLNENVQITSLSTRNDLSSSKGGDLQSLTKLLEIHLSPSESSVVKPKLDSVVFIEPLLSADDLKLHVLRIYSVLDTEYSAFCEKLAVDRAIIVERPRYCKKTPQWCLARVVGFDKCSGSHSIVRMSGWREGFVTDKVCLDSEQGRGSFLSSAICFDEIATQVILCAREYCIVGRNKLDDFPFAVLSSSNDIPDAIMTETISTAPSNPPIGSRIESNCGPSRTWATYTLVGASKGASLANDGEYEYRLVSDEGEIFAKVALDQLKMVVGQESNRLRRRSTRDERSGIFPFFDSRNRYEVTNNNSDELQSITNRDRALKRNWSALALADVGAATVDLNVPTKQTVSFLSSDSQYFYWDVHYADSTVSITANTHFVEFPPQMNVNFSTTQGKAPCLNIHKSADQTMIRSLKDLYTQQATYYEWPPKTPIKLFFSISKIPEPSTTASSEVVKQLNASPTTHFSVYDKKSDSDLRPDNRSRKLSSRAVGVDDDAVPSTVCEGLDELCMQCLELIGLLSECAENGAVQREKDDTSLACFASTALSKKLSDQLDADPLCVVGGALPDWCLAAASFAPRAFTYDSRKALLERAAFGVSRSTFRQQEARINVARLRQRMSSLRARAVELVGEAFSGGAEDPTALQLQADELYGMEEALATRVRASFRAAMWQEHSLQVAKAAVRREYLLNDAAAIMEKYAKDPLVCRRRLEVRFVHESGFDAASGDEAGVTRGFYADVAEALLSGDIIATTNCASQCSSGGKEYLKKSDGIGSDDIENYSLKLPLWIPDFDSSSAVVIPTPRADKRSSLGIFPRPIPSYHPQCAEVLAMFRLIGRLFASAMRDGFMFPLPLSSAFLKLVQCGKIYTSSLAMLEGFGGSGSMESILNSNDLPRPGFIGGEIFAAEYYVCRVLDDLDSLNPPLSQSELKQRYDEVDNDVSFGRVALGKSYNLSFKEYFEERTFVDPLDPSQGEDAIPLCPKGYLKPVTIYNIREWVVLAKSFFLQEGVLQQALAFRMGVEDFFPADYLRLFTATELQRDICGTGGDVENWDEGVVRKLFKLDGGKGATEALVAVAAIGGEGGAALSRRFGPSSPTIAFLMKSLIDATAVQRRQFLSFVTSVPIVTPGRIEVVPIVSPGGEFLPMNDPSCLPRANTCSRRLYLPKFDTYEKFSEVLWAVVREESKFKGFYEWRGS